MRLLTVEDLAERGIRYSRSQRNRLIKAGRFPAPVRFSANGRPAWLETEVDNYITGLLTERDARTEGADACAAE